MTDYQEDDEQEYVEETEQEPDEDYHPNDNVTAIFEGEININEVEEILEVEGML